MKQKIFEILINEEIVLELEEISQLINQNLLSYIDMELLDTEKSDLVYEQDFYRANKRQKH